MKQIVNLYKNFQKTCQYHKIVSRQHLNSVNMTYSEHLKHSSGFSLMFIKSSYKALVHGLFPSIYVTSSSDTILKCLEKMKDGKNENK